MPNRKTNLTGLSLGLVLSWEPAFPREEALATSTHLLSRGYVVVFRNSRPTNLSSIFLC